MNAKGAGRPPKPTQLKIVAGIPGHRPINKNEPHPETKQLTPPDWLDGVAKETFKELEKLLRVEMGVLTVADQMALEMLCDAYAEYKAARKVILKHGNSFKETTKNGVITRIRAEVGIAEKSWKRIKSILGEFGLTPSSRSRLKVEKKEEIDPLEELIGRKV